MSLSALLTHHGEKKWACKVYGGTVGKVTELWQKAFRIRILAEMTKGKLSLAEVRGKGLDLWNIRLLENPRRDYLVT